MPETKQHRQPPRPTNATLDDRRWSAVLARDAGCERSFVYAVVTTGIYCRSSCPARRPQRDNVHFFATPREAEAQGFRACKRCNPNSASGRQSAARSITAACRHIEAAETAPSLSALAASAGLSPCHFHRLFKSATGVTPKAYWRATCTLRVRQALSAHQSVTAALHSAGFSTTAQFYAIAQGILGMPPALYRKGAKSVPIQFAVAQSSLGSILVAATEKGICAVLLGDDPQTLKNDLRQRFREAHLIEGDPRFAATVAKVVAHAEHPTGHLDLPLDIKGTAFQERIWQALRKVAPGSTTTYGEIARTLGIPSASRAVAGACAANPVAILVPCHRVVRSDGALSGYRWGAARKRELLNREALNEKGPRRGKKS